MSFFPIVINCLSTKTTLNGVVFTYIRMKNPIVRLVEKGLSYHLYHVEYSNGNGYFFSWDLLLNKYYEGPYTIKGHSTSY